MICLFSQGSLSGLQFEMDEPPYKIRSESLEEIPRQLSYSSASFDPMDGIVKPMYKRNSEVYIRCEVHLETSTNLKETIVVYKLERAW